MKALILAAGYATRLKPLTDYCAKPLLPVGQKRMIDHIVDQLERVKGLNEILVVTNRCFATSFELWAERRRIQTPDIPICILDDGSDTVENRLGAIGDIAFVLDRKQVAEDLLIIAGDNLFDYDLAHIAERFQQLGHDMVLGRELEAAEDPSRFAIVEIDAEGRILHMEEKPAEPRSRLAAFATYFYKKDSLPLFKTYLQQGGNPDSPGHFPAWLYQKRPVYLYVFEGQCYDIGTLEAYERVQGLFL